MTEQIFTLSFAAAAGVILVVIATRLKMPSIAFLLVGGILLGPEILGVIDPATLGTGLQLVVGLAVAIILFEGGLTLDLAGARKSPVVISRMLTIGVVITWLGTTLVLWKLFDLRPSLALLAGSLVIVTGPTVVSPLLRRISVRERIKHILYWEAVLIDAIGVFIAVLCFEWLTPNLHHDALSPVLRFAYRVGVGAGIGLGSGVVVAAVLRRNWVPQEQINIFVLAWALLTYAVCESILHESGILAVIVSGLVVGLTKPRHLEELRRFKLELTELGIGMIFILLAATLSFEPFYRYGWRLGAAVVVLLVVLRPLVIIASTWGREFSLQEKAFLSWVAPRGIVAAFMASLFTLRLSDEPDAALLQSFTFAVIGTTVLLQGLSAPMVARLLGLQKAPRLTWLIVGEEPIAMPMAGALRAAGGRAIALVPEHGEGGHDRDDDLLLHANPLSRTLFDHPRFADVGAVVSVSPNLYFNQVVCQRWVEVVGAERCYRTAETAIDEQPLALGAAGKPVWSHAAPVAELIAGLEAGNLAIDPVAIDAQAAGTTLAERFGPHLVPLFAVASPHVEILAGSSALAPGIGSIVALRRRIPGLADLIADALLIDGRVPDLDEVVRALLERAAQTAAAGIDVDELHRTIMERERSMPTAMGTGLSIPHAYHPTLARSQCYVANVRGGIPSPTPDGEPIRLVFLVLSPVGQAEAHLRGLAAIAHLAHEPGFIALLEQQRTVSDMLARIAERA